MNNHLNNFDSKINDATVKIWHSEIKENTNQKLLGITFHKKTKL